MIPERLAETSDSISQWLSWLWVIALSGWGGAVSYFHKVDRHALKFSFVKFAMEIATSAFVGVLTFLICDAANLSWEITAAMVGVSGHMGTRALFIIEKRYENFINGDKDGNS